jgi:hypothetical protein
MRASKDGGTVEARRACHRTGHFGSDPLRHTAFGRVAAIRPMVVFAMIQPKLLR